MNFLEYKKCIERKYHHTFTCCILPHRITEWLDLEGISGGHLVQPSLLKQAHTETPQPLQATCLSAQLLSPLLLKKTWNIKKLFKVPKHPLLNTAQISGLDGPLVWQLYNVLCYVLLQRFSLQGIEKTNCSPTQEISSTIFHSNHSRTLEFIIQFSSIKLAPNLEHVCDLQCQPFLSCIWFADQILSCLALGFGVFFFLTRY